MTVPRPRAISPQHDEERGPCDRRIPPPTAMPTALALRPLLGALVLGMVEAILILSMASAPGLLRWAAMALILSSVAAILLGFATGRTAPTPAPNEERS